MSALPCPAPAERIALARVALELRLFFRDRQQVIFSFLYPVVMLLIFGSVFHDERVAGGVTYTQYFVSGIAATGIVLASFQAVGTRIAEERDSGELARLQALGTPPVAYFAGKAGQVLAVIVAQLAILLAVARLAFDLPLPSDMSRWLTLAWMTVLGSGAGTVLGVAVSAIPRRATTAQAVIAPVAIVLQFFSGVFFVYSELPTWMRDVAAVFPLKWLTQGMRSVFLPNRAARAEVAGGWQHGTTALVLSAWVVIGVIVCARRFRWRNEMGARH